ncbi:MAG: aquaporin [Clostridia bacterium]|nr:aquaporin [Clostridia bacterium]
MNSLFKKCLAECIGTFTLVFVACGVAGATGGSLVATALAFGLTIVAMAYSIGRVSGCHINPAVSLGCLLTKRMSAKDFIAYVISQLIGGALGALLIFGVIKYTYITIHGLPCGNACNYVVGYGENESVFLGAVLGTLIVEAVLTCIFVYTILNVTDEKAGTGKIAGFVIGLTLTLVHLVGIPLTGTSVNPARSIATALADVVYNGKYEAISQVWMFIVAPLLGAIAAAIFYKILNTEKE